MKLFLFAIGCLCAVFFNNTASAQAFRKGTLLVSLTEGSTNANYSTTNTNTTTDVLQQQNISGDRDPLTVEFGLSKHFGIGLNTGIDVFRVDPQQYYGYQTANYSVKTFMSEFTVEGDYHFYVTKKLDLSVFSALGVSSVTFKGNDGDHSYNYNAGGGIIRTGARARYYFFHGLGVMGMVSAFSSNCSTKDVKENTAGQGYDTKIQGAAIEFGLCYRILR